MTLNIPNSILTENNLQGLLGDFSYTETPNTWKLKKRCLDGGHCIIKIDKELMNSVLNLTQNYTFENDLSLYKKKRTNIEDSYEHVIKIQYKHQSLEIEHLKTNNLDISISPISKKYSLFLYLKNKLWSLSDDALVNLEMNLKKFKNKTIDFWEIIQYLNEDLFNIQSIKIITPSPLSHYDMKRLANAYLFKCAYHSNAIISMQDIFREYHPIFPNDRFWYDDETITALDINNEILILYQQALRFKDPFESYLSFYHIIEYYFQMIGNKFKKDITIPNQFQGSDKDYERILSNCFNEPIRLELVLRRYVDQAWLKKELEFFDEDYYTYLENNKVEFAKANKINDSNFYKTLADRIYKIRNALVHRKEGHEGKYRPSEKEHKEALRKELVLMKVIVNHILINKRGTLLYI